MSEERFWILLTRYLSKEATLKENEELQDLVSYNQQYRSLFERAVHNWKIGKEDGPVVFDTEKIKSKVWTALGEEESLYEKGKRPVYYATAAVLLLLAVVGYIFYASYFIKPELEVVYLTKTTQRGEKATVTLSDGSTIRLNAESSVSFPRRFIGDTRAITLTGEAFFTVIRNPDKPFTVKTADLITNVLGTSFNVKAFAEDEVQVTVTSGLVQVLSQGVSKPMNQNLQLTLNPSEQATFYPVTGQLTKQENIETKKYTAWKDGIIYFDDIKLDDALEILERWYGINIALKDPEIADCVIVGEYHNETLQNVLRSMQFGVGIEYEFTQDGVVITGNGC